MIKLQSSDGRLFVVDMKTISLSTFIKNLIEDLGNNNELLQLPNVKGEILDLVIRYCDYHKDDVQLSEGEVDLFQDKFIVSPWDRKFMQMEDSTMLQLLNAADYLGIEPLVELCCLSIAKIIRDLSADEICLRYGIVDDFTDAQRKHTQALRACLH
ncbi:E3 ubiquitin ligase SCF complex, Skp subunit [Coemansia reversa NRRL 1564]|uniref:E3 ubiquitin ligase complex SCF subunit n=1 Tax=Coemansia reversa (strain ATCC 12441 / NRRL 1564) TaxID=763665 RepID=A0A2G5BCH2_COERN|nr:E3 ubiquitin ligase SCF complex, Skp subunit [Coemansia reversa NRRL 1564]|eukprot:PIA16718.1 E3 ubiquitin ligase SCF complex, Skp subunit [Coemansia reversa NRRL 1564]